MGTIISDCGCCTTFTVRSCCDTDVTPPSTMTLTVGVTGCSGELGILYDNDTVICSGIWNQFTLCGESGSWTIPMTQVAPPAGTNFAYAWVNGPGADYFGGHYPEQGAIPASLYGAAFYPDQQGYSRQPHPLAGCTAPYCGTPYAIVLPNALFNCADMTPLTLGPNLGVSVFMGACSPQFGGNGAVLIFCFLDLDTPHIDTCDCLGSDGCGHPHQGGYIGSYTCGAPWNCTNPSSGWSFLLQNSGGNPITMGNACGTCFGETALNIFGNPVWVRDHIIYQFALDHTTLQGGSGQCVTESTLNDGVCIGSLFGNDYTLTISGDIAQLNGSYTLSYKSTQPLTYLSSIQGPYCCEGQTIYVQWGLQAARDDSGKPTWLLGRGPETGYADTFTCPETDGAFTASGSFTVNDPCFGSGTVNWTVS